MRRVALALSLVLASISSCAAESDIIGQASVIDGDTIVIHGTHIRLWGILSRAFITPDEHTLQSTFRVRL